MLELQSYQEPEELSFQNISDEKDISSDSSDQSPDFEAQEPSTSKKLKIKGKKMKPKKFNTTKLNNTAKESVRWGVSPRVAAAIANAVLVDYKVNCLFIPKGLFKKKLNK